MKVLLTKDVPHLGQAGEAVDVADGYARNYLLPKKLAVKATKAAMRMAEQYRKKAEMADRLLVSEAEQTVQKLEGLEIDITATADENGHLYGSVTEKDIAEELAKQDVEVDRRHVEMDQHLKMVGEHKVTVRMHDDIKGQVLVRIRAEGEG
ncbi:50S ribosomal protein L9 [Candidatus Fermentibacteria bacterium]|nr:50S ribosomal protein L9 [Candidatus Fermentibacteria bacterium]